MPVAKSVLKIAIFPLATAIGQVALAQPVVMPPPVLQEGWTATPAPDRPSVQISRTAVDGSARFVGGCDKALEPGVTGTFSDYQGANLQKVDGQTERVLFEVRGGGWKDAYAVQLRYSDASRSWEIAKPLAPVFLDSFARGGQLVVVNSQRQEVFAFDLVGSANAVRTMRTVCGFTPGEVD